MKTVQSLRISKKKPTQYGGVFEEAGTEEKIKKIEEETAQPDFWNDSEKAEKTFQNLNMLKDGYYPWKELIDEINETEELIELYQGEDDESLREELEGQIEKLDEKFKAFMEFFKGFQVSLKSKCYQKDTLITYLTGNEAQGAVYYWNYMRSLLADDDIGFEKRVRKGATDLMNMMLNYGYAILYNRVWQALLGARLNPFDSIIHCRQTGKPTFVYDMVEIFRAQVVDRVVITLIQKGVSLRTDNGLLATDTRRQLSQAVLDRLNRYENYRGEEITLEEIIRRQMNEIARFIEKDIRYKPYIAKW